MNKSKVLELESFRKILDSIPAHVFVSDMETCEILYMNQVMIENFGGDRTGLLCYEVFRGEKEICSHCPNSYLIDETGQPGESYIWEGLNNKTGHWYQNQDQAMVCENGRLVKVQVAVDIQDTKAALHSLELSNERYRSLFESSQTALLTVAPPDWRLISGNPAQISLFDFEDEQEFLAADLWDLSPTVQPGGRKSKEEFLEMITLSGKSGSHLFRWVFKKKNGAEFPAIVQITRVDLDGEYILQISITDITDQISAETLLRQKMDDLGLISSLNHAANRTENLLSIFKLLSRDLRRNFDSINSTVFLFSEDGEKLQVDTRTQDPIITKEIEKGINFSVPTHLVLDHKDIRVFQEIIRSGKPQILTNREDLQNYMRDLFSASNLSDIIKYGASVLVPQSVKAIGIKSMMILPLLVSGKLIGLMDISSRDIFSEEDLNRVLTIAGQISGIIQRVKAESDRAYSIRELELINKSFDYSTASRDINEICQHLADQVHKVNPDAYVMVSLFDSEYDEIMLRAMQGFGGLEDKITKTLGRDPKSFIANRSKISLSENLQALYRSGKLVKTPGGLYDLTKYFVSPRVNKVLVRFTGIEEIYLVGFNAGDELLGGIMLGLKKGQKVQFSSAIEVIVNHFTGIFESRLNQDEIQHRKTQLEALRSIEIDITSTLNLEELLYSIAEKAAQIVDAIASGFSVYNPDTDMLDFLVHAGNHDLPTETSLNIGEGLSGKVWQEQRTIIVENYAEWEGRSSTWAQMGNYFLVGIPVRWGDDVLGVLELVLDPGDRLSPRSIELLEMFATQAAIAIKNAQLYDAEKKKRQEAETLRELGMLINSNLDRDELLDLILISLQKVIPYHSASIQLVSGDYCVIEAFRSDRSADGVIGRNIDISKNTLAHPVLYDGKSVILNDVVGNKEWIAGDETLGIHSWIAVPLQAHGERLGILTLDHRDVAKYTERDADLVLNFANQVAIALENNRLLEDARQRLFRIESLRQIDLVISGSLDLESTMNVLVRQLISSLDVDAATVLILNKEINMLEYISSHGFITDSLKHTSLRIGEGLAGKSAQEKKMVMIKDLIIEEISLKRSPTLVKEGFRTYIAFPLLVKKEVVGVLEVFHRSVIDPDHEWIGFLESLAHQAAIAIDRLNLFNDLEDSNIDLIRAYDATIEGWAKAIELRDSETEGHSRRVVELTIQLAMRMGISGEDLLNIRRGALLHDIGKMAIPDKILMKPDSLSDLEWSQMKEHPVYAYEMLSPIGYLQNALDIPYYHHERWDGMGYPKGIAGEEIPQAARIFAVVDVWDALQSDRPYRPAWTFQEAKQYVMDNSGTHFDPEVVSEFLEMITLIRENQKR